MNIALNSQRFAVSESSLDIVESRDDASAKRSRNQFPPKMTKQEELRSLTDRDLIGRIKTVDDIDAWEELMSRHVDKAFQVAYGILGQRNDAEEVTQDAFLRIYRALPKFRGESEFTTWMYRVALNHCRNLSSYEGRRGKGGGSLLDALGDET